MPSQPSKQTTFPGENLLVFLMAATVLGLVWGMMCTAPGIPWNGARLAPLFALARGLPL